MIAMTIRKIVRTATPAVQNGTGAGFFARSARKFSSARIAHSNISLLKKVSLIALQQQEAILDIWITVHLYALKIGETLFWASLLEVAALEHCAPHPRDDPSP